jgi:hypothetical protein
MKSIMLHLFRKTLIFLLYLNLLSYNHFQLVSTYFSKADLLSKNFAEIKFLDSKRIPQFSPMINNRRCLKR